MRSQAVELLRREQQTPTEAPPAATGAAVAEASPGVFCPSCGAPVEATWRFCTACGGGLPAGAAAEGAAIQTASGGGD